MGKNKKEVEESTFGLYEVRRGLLPLRKYWCDNEFVAVNNYIRDFRLAPNLDKKLFDVERTDNKDTEAS